MNEEIKIDVMPYKPDALFEHDKSEGEVYFRSLHALGETPVKGEVKHALESFAEGWAHNQVVERHHEAQQREIDRKAWDEAMLKHRYGIIFVAQEFLERDPLAVSRMLREVIVVRCESMYTHHGFEYTAISPHLAPTDPGNMLPRYTVMYHSDEDRVQFVQEQLYKLTKADFTQG